VISTTDMIVLVAGIAAAAAMWRAGRRRGPLHRWRKIGLAAIVVATIGLILLAHQLRGLGPAADGVARGFSNAAAFH